MFCFQHFDFRKNDFFVFFLLWGPIGRRHGSFLETSATRPFIVVSHARMPCTTEASFGCELRSISQIRIILLLQPANSPDTDANDAAFYRSLEYVLGETRQQRPVEVTQDFLPSVRAAFKNYDAASMGRVSDSDVKALESTSPAHWQHAGPGIAGDSGSRGKQGSTMRARRGRITGTSCRLEPTSSGTQPGRSDRD
jgi:hypothetical protein